MVRQHGIFGLKGRHGILSDSTLTGWLENGTSVTIRRNQISRMGLTLWLILLVEEALDPNTNRPD